LNKGLRNFILACLIVVALAAGGVYGISRVVKLYPEKLPWSLGQRISGQTLPEDIPLYKGAVLSESTVNSGRSTFKYILPLGSQTSAFSFYASQMPDNGWEKMAEDENYLAFYKTEGKRRANIRIKYESGKATLVFDLSGRVE
jgi:hypothetical protein